MTKRRAFSLLLAASQGMAAGGCVPPPSTPAAAGSDHGASAAHPNVEAARLLDQEGIRSFRAGRFGDAVAYFRAAYSLGGPSSELWNIVRSREGMDDAEGAAAAIDDYLGAKDLAPQDRADAEREAQGLRARTSTLTIGTTPSGALVTLDGKPVPGSTPISVEIHAGTHTLAVRRDGYALATQSIDARFGRAVIVTLDLERGGK